MQQRTGRREFLRLLAASGASLAATSCGGGGGNGQSSDGGQSGDDETIARSLAEITPQNQAATFRNVDRLAPTRAFTRSGPVRSLPPHERSLGALRYEFQGQSHTLEGYMNRHRSAGLLVVKGGAIALERYGMGNDRDSRWTSFSIAKSLTSTLAGAALHQGSLTSLDLRVESLLPAYARSAYGGTTVRQLLRMTSGVRWNEDYESSTSDITLMTEAIASARPDAVRAFMLTRERATAPGSTWNYSTGDSYVLGAVVAAATGRSLSALVTESIWSRAGMQADGYWLLDAPNGLELGGSAFSATLRDYGRLGLFVLHDGVIGAQRELPVGWRSLAGTPDTPLTAAGTLYPGDPRGYGYHWWTLPTGAFMAAGIFGQFLYIDPAEDLIVVVWSAWLTTWDFSAERETYALFEAITDALH